MNMILKGEQEIDNNYWIIPNVENLDKTVNAISGTWNSASYSGFSLRFLIIYVHIVTKKIDRLHQCLLNYYYYYYWSLFFLLKG